MITLSKIIPLIFLSIGIFLLMQIFLPFASFQLWMLGQNFQNGILISPNSSESDNVLGVSIQNKDSFPAFVSSLKRETIANYSELKLSIPKLKKGDEIDINAGGVNYRYEVIETKIVDPTNTSVINPPDKTGRFISLMTCFPPGLNFKRMVVIGKMI